MMKKYLQVILLCITVGICPVEELWSQTPEIVVSEYLNLGVIDDQGTPAPGEWTELLVIKDNTSLVGYTLRDNSSGGNWVGGIRFKDVPLWRNLRGGTTILILHRTNDSYTTSKDLLPRDGRIYISAEETEYFEQFMDPSQSNTWAIGALNINAGSDILQIRNQNDIHVHALAHGKQSDPVFISLPVNAKLNHSNGLTGSLRVYPGRTIEEYVGANPSNSKTTDANVNKTEGKPNLNTAGEDDNSIFWRKIKEPEWSNPTMTGIALASNTVKLSWNAMTDPNPSDDIQGYMILTTDDFSPDTNALPQDGKSYVMNETIGNWRVVDIVNSTTTNYDDLINFKNIPCGGSYKYRVFAFRFSVDDTDPLDSQKFPKLARGRQYLTDKFASGRARKPAITKPDITYSGGVLVGQTIQMCQGSTLTFSSTSASQYQWYKDNQPLTNQTARTLAVTQSGRYYVEVTNDVGCTSQSDDYVVEFVPIPTIIIKQGKTAKICSGQSLQLEASGGLTYTWFKDKSVISGQTGSVISINQPGDYTVSSSNSAGCADTSDIITVTIRTTAFATSATTLDFGELDGCRSSKDATLEVSNTGNDTLRITTVNTPTDFTLAFPPLPLVIPPETKQNLFFRFSRNSQGTSTGKATITAIPCTTSQEIDLKGTKLKPDYSADRSEVNFADKLTCEVAEQDSLFNITNNGQDALSLIGYPWNLKPPFSVIGRIPDRDVIQPGSTIRIRISYTPPTGAAVYQDELKIPYVAGNCKDTMRIVVKAQRKKPELTSVGASEINFKQLLGCDKTVTDSLVIRNNSKQPVFVKKQPTDTTYKFLSLPDTIKAGESKTLVISFTPENEGDYSALLPLFVEGCDDTALVIQVRGNKKSASAILSSPATGIDFGDVFSCDPVASAEDTVRLSLSNFNSDVTIDNLVINEPFSTNLTKGQIVSSGESIIIRFNPRFDQSYRDTLKVRLLPCNIEKSIPLSGRRLPSTFQWTKSFDFGTVDTGQSRTQKITFKNTSRSAVTVNGLVGLTNPPFAITLTSKDFPATLTPNDSLVVTIEYSPKKAIRDSIIATFSINAPCDTSFAVTLKGLGRAKNGNPGSSSATFYVENTQAKPGERFKLNVMLRSPDTAKFSLLKVYRLELKLSYNSTIMMPLSVKTGQPQIGYRTSVTETSPGFMTLMIEHPAGQNATTFITDGKLAEIEGLAMLGDAISTKVKIIEDNITGNALKPTDISYGEGILALTDVCNLNGRIVKIGGQAGITITSQTSEGIEFTFENVSTDFTSIEVFSYMGKKVETLTAGHFSPSVRSTFLPTHSLANGTYYIVYKAGIFTYTFPFFISR